MAPAGQIKGYINHYNEAGDYVRMIKLYEELVKLEKKNINNFIELAKLYAVTGDTEKAVEIAMQVAEKDPSTKDYVNDFIEGLK